MISIAGLWTERLTVNDYQALLDSGWRRSGCYLYKPEMEKTCCPSYTIRLKASDFVPSKEQQRVRRRIERYMHLCGCIWKLYQDLFFSYVIKPFLLPLKFLVELFL
jgi:arginyl-tRNA--protein-N-Asp/Glu arginylyltransferase